MSDEEKSLRNRADIEKDNFISDRNFWRAVSAEFFAMFIFVFVCVGGALTNLGIPKGTENAILNSETFGANKMTRDYSAYITICFTFGFCIFVLAHSIGHISGGHINPAVTVCLMVAKQCSVPRGIFYIAARMMGSIVASGVIMGMLGLDADSMGGYNAVSGPDDNKVARAFISEFFLTGLLCFTVLATVDPVRAPSGFGPLAIGMAVTLAHFFAVPITGCGINPARSLGPAVFSSAEKATSHLWIFLLAPMMAGVVTAPLYTFWFAQENFGSTRFGMTEWKSGDRVENKVETE